jgi:hypothetical protein
MNDDTEIEYQRVVFVDSEFDAKVGKGEPPGPPVCFCALEIDALGSVVEHRLSAPYPARLPWERNSPFLTVGFALGAEAGSLMHIGWPFPVPAIDLYAEYMVLHNTEMSRGESKEPGPSLIRACQRYRVAGMDAAHKDAMRALVYTKLTLTPEEIEAEKDYCLEDCRMTMRLFCAMRQDIDFLRAPVRGAFMMELERMRWRGLPIDEPLYQQTKRRAPIAAAGLRTELNRRLGAEIFLDNVFKRKAMFAWMRQSNIPIPIDPKTQRDSLATKLIKGMIETYPPLKDYYEFSRMIKALGSLKLEIGADGRNRFWMNPFGTKTGRNNPSTNRALLGLPHTMRSFMKPPPGMAIAQIDFGAQEIGIAAALSKDPTLMADYMSGDPYREFAAASLGVSSPTKQQRQVYKACVLGRIYGMGPGTLARNLGIAKREARRILEQMGKRYPVVNAWLERILTKVAHGMPITCTLGWSLSAVGKPGEDRTFLNFPMQANGAEIMRLVFVRASELNIIGCAHDSFLIEAPEHEIAAAVARMQEIMRAASRDLLDGFELRADCDLDKDIVRYPDRFIDEREREAGLHNWNWLMKLIEEDEHEQGETIIASDPAGNGAKNAGAGNTETNERKTGKDDEIRSLFHDRPDGMARIAAEGAKPAHG